MAVPRKPQPAPPNGFVASAARLPAVKPNMVRSGAGWQDRAWEHYDTLGEVRFVANWVGNMLSRAVLVAAKRDGPTYVPLDSGPAADTMQAYFGGQARQAEMLQQDGIHLTVSGEMYHLAYGKDDTWTVLAGRNVKQSGKKVSVTIAGERIVLDDDDLIHRVWHPHPVHIEQADSPMRSNMSILAELQQLNAHVLSQLESRLTGAGILFMPSEIQFSVPDGVDPQANLADAFVQLLGDVMSTAIKDRSSAAAHTPIVVTAPGEHLDKVQHVTFWTPLDAAVIAMREHAVKRLALGMDTPPEVMLGIGDSNHWSSWLVSEEAIKSHLEPRLQVIVNAITTAYLRPALVDLVPDPESYVVLADTSQIRMRPNRSSEAIELYDRGVLSERSLRRETGFDEVDGPLSDEFVRWLLKKVATGSTSPEQTVAALKELGADIAPAILSGVNRPPGDDIRIDTRRRVLDQRKPDPARATDEKMERDMGMALVAAAEVLVYRALERAGNRLLNQRTKRSDDTPVCERYLTASGQPDVLLDGTWDFALKVLEPLHPRPAAVVSVLDLYVRGLLTAQVAHTREALCAALAHLEVTA